MRNFADLVKLPDPTKKEVQMNNFLKSVHTLMEAQAREKEIQLVLQIPEQPFFISADMQQMEQALINILKNAIEAIGFGGVVTLALDAETKQLSITDTGVGLTNAQSEQLFIPFFSTKKDGQGIGLTMVREILNNHGYGFSLKTHHANCTIFSIQLTSTLEKLV